MILWIDAQISPKIAKWVEDTFSIKTYHISEFKLTQTTDREIFLKAKQNSTDETICILTKDIDFVLLLEQYKVPPKIIWLTSGNASNEKIKLTLSKALKEALHLLNQEDLIEIR
ncbi:MAG TPA: DUF5615 family PIN-like protein [Leptospiraceae bacterium]|nr:DUF5615 family PIN-like protein [Leptospiraceae bacterium]HMW04230.1 DUF5615 family PIN-like protein [Leptospiraceae bacterium]HMX34305.1 DUF5615 family PIN-like protein [Leptospiraceae bacterium]HMY31276.1 DUF5615 family PIN-like protein [Leptospiraceae bacterium]HMZ63389.1 DUF5615 family PIN-like protein [Leptospiraceae bacterium]